MFFYWFSSIPFSTFCPGISHLHVEGPSANVIEWLFLLFRFGFSRRALQWIISFSFRVDKFSFNYVVGFHFNKETLLLAFQMEITHYLEYKKSWSHKWFIIYYYKLIIRKWRGPSGQDYCKIYDSVTPRCLPLHKQSMPLQPWMFSWWFLE